MRRASIPTLLLLAACSSRAESPQGATPEPTATTPASAASGIATATTSTTGSASAVAGVPDPPPPKNVPVDPGPLPKGLKVLVIGDSFAEALGAGLRRKEGDFGGKAVLRGEKATFIPEWAGPRRGVNVLLLQEKPDLVVIALGGNELAMTTPEIRGPKIKELVKLIGETPCVWVSPPLWGNKDNGLLGVIRENSAPCRWFDSNVHSPDLPRGGDKIHPTAEGQVQWATTFLEWVRKERNADAKTFALRPRPSDE
jgi:lysophospholipase L1-like esterase